MVVDEALLGRARAAGGRLAQARHETDRAKADYHHAIRRLHLSGATLREIADALQISHQRVHQIIEATGGAPEWRHRAKTTAELACTFCGAPKAGVRRLIAGPAVFICEACVARAGRVVRDGRPIGTGHGRLVAVSVGGDLTCSFCHRHRDELAALAAAAAAHICDECVAFCVEVVASTSD